MGVSALSSAHSVVMLQLDRFQIEGGQVWKNSVPIALPTEREVRIPCFQQESSIEVSFRVFRIVAVMIHVGDRMLQGHYLCAWRGQSVFLHDDHRVELLDGLSPTHCCGVYLALAVRC